MVLVLAAAFLMLAAALAMLRRFYGRLTQPTMALLPIVLANLVGTLALLVVGAPTLHQLAEGRALQTGM